MKANKAKALVTELLAMADITVNGNKPWDPKVHNEQFYSRLLHDRELGLGESYMDGWWDCEKMDELITRVLCAKLPDKVKANKAFLFRLVWFKLFNHQTKKRSVIVGKEHYDIGNHLYERMLDQSMNYSCGYWRDADNLDQAQFNKMDLICQKLQLKPGMKVLDIGCGWGGMAKHAAEHYGVNVVGITISEEQAKLARERTKDLPVEIRFQDYRDLNETFDAIISIGMFEHVGPKNYRDYFKVANRVLKEKGLFLLHTIGDNVTSATINPWMEKYIFPNAALPSVAHIGKTSENLFVLEDWHSFGAYYDTTLMAWYDNFNKAWPELKSEKYDERFKRMWHHYLLCCAASFRSRYIQLWQLVLSKDGVNGVYNSIRTNKAQQSMNQACSA